MEATFLPLKQYELDAAIIFSDILLPLRAMGASVEFGEEGPVLGAPQNEAELKKLKRNFDPKEGTPTILKALSELRKALPKEKAVLGFSGAPFTLLVYLMEGKVSKDLGKVKRWLMEQPQLMHETLNGLAEMTADYLEAQVDAGADAVQMFDTWASVLSPQDYEEFALPYARKVLGHVTAPSVYYINGCAGILEKASSAGAQCLSIDWKIDLQEARRRVPQVTALQGNLDPYALHLPKSILRDRVLKMMEGYGRGPGHIVNLGHGIMPSAPEDSLKVMIEAVHEFKM